MIKPTAKIFSFSTGKAILSENTKQIKILSLFVLMKKKRSYIF